MVFEFFWEHLLDLGKLYSDLSQRHPKRWLSRGIPQNDLNSGIGSLLLAGSGPLTKDKRQRTLGNWGNLSRIHEPYLEDLPRTCKWLRTMVNKSLFRIGLFPFLTMGIQVWEPYEPGSVVGFEVSELWILLAEQRHGATGLPTTDSVQVVRRRGVGFLSQSPHEIFPI